jgi:glyoxylase-like metal-dependent hydrolase (beta-lactamase superfamily II)
MSEQEGGSTVTPAVDSFFHERTNTITHLVSDPATGHAAVIDSVLDFDPRALRTTTEAVDQLIAHIGERKLSVDWILETHLHADHMSAAPYLREALGGQTAIGEHVRDVQKTFAGLYNAGPELATDGSQFDRLLADGEVLTIGDLELEVMSTPGHTPACASYRVGDALFVGDTIFMEDFGTARCDFPGGDARILYQSIQRLLSLPDETRMFLCHDYGPNGRAIAWETTVGAQRRGNIHVKEGISEDAFAAKREARDATLELPELIFQSVQVNMCGGQLPKPESNGLSYLKMPINAF